MFDEDCYSAGNEGLAMPMGLEEDLKPSSYSLEQHPNSQTTVNFELNHQLNSQLMQDMYHNWDSKLGQQQQEQQIDLQCFNPGPAPFIPYAQTPTPDLLNFIHLPNSSIPSFANPNKRPSHFPTSLDISGSSLLYDSQLHLDLPPQQTPIFKELFQSVSHNQNYAAVLDFLVQPIVYL